ncbi:MAG TPA: DUF697 domain-containing protein [Stellaceae bacterium]|nr:DUF697 domain-containing protein [Stellaceae bacterium]
MAKTLPKLRSPTLEDIKRTATAATPAVEERMAAATAPAPPPTTPMRTALPALIPEPADERDRRRYERARAIVARYRKWTIAAAAAPIPLADAVLIGGVQLRMLAQLAGLYGVPFEKVRVVSLVSALFGGWTPYTISIGVAGAAARMAPGFGTLIGIATSVGTSTLATEAIGKIFIQHFEEGGTFLDFEPRKYSDAVSKSVRGGGKK